MSKVRVIQWGLGAMGIGMVKLLMERKGVELVAAISRHKAGEDLGEAIGLGKKLGIKVQGDPKPVLGKNKADVLLLATHSFVKDVYPQIIFSS